MSDNNKKVDALDIVFGIAFVLIILVVSFYGWNFRGSSISDNISNWGAFGDYVGGIVNPILAFFSFMALLITLDLQRKQLNKTEEQLELNREELKLTREELKKAADAQIDSAKVMSEQLKTQALQQFDSFFFNLFDQLSSRIDSLVKIEEFNKTYATIFSQVTVGNASGRKVLLLENQNVSSLFIFLFQILKTIDSQQIADDIKKKYTNIIRSILPQQVLQLLMITRIADKKLT